MERLRAHAAELLAEEVPLVLAGDYNVIPTPTHDDVFSVRAMQHDALMQPESRAALRRIRSEEHTSELQSLMRISYPVFCLEKKKKNKTNMTSRNYRNNKTKNK